MLVKICGISTVMDAMAAARCKADFVGFVMGGNVLPPEVEPHAQTVREIIKQLPPVTESFIVTHLTEIEDILELAEYVNSSGIQVSEDIGFEKLKQIRELTNRKIIKTIVVDKEHEESCFKKLKHYEPYCDFILLDTRVSGYTGGTGVTNDWELCRKLIAKAKKPVLLAGGLTPNNVKQAIEMTHPHGVDVSTGVSTYSQSYPRKDRKDEHKIRKFIRIAKAKNNRDEIWAS